METPGNYNNINGLDDLGWHLREQKRAAILNCVPVFIDILRAAGFNLAEFFNAMSVYRPNPGGTGAGF